MSDGLSDFLARAGERPLLTPAEERELGTKALHGDLDARNKLVERNIRLAVSLAARWQGNGVPLDDLVQEAILGLHSAAGKFDPSKGYKFSTYATRWVNRNLWNVVNTTGPDIKRSDEVAMRIGRIRKARRERPGADVRELAAAARCTEPEVVEALSLDRTMARFDADESTGDRRSLHEVVPSGGELGVFEAPEASDADVARAIAALPEDERLAVGLRFGLDGKPRTLADTAAELHVGREQADRLVRQGQARLQAALAWKFDTTVCERPEPSGAGRAAE